MNIYGPKTHNNIHKVDYFIQRNAMLKAEAFSIVNSNNSDFTLLSIAQGPGVMASKLGVSLLKWNVQQMKEQCLPRNYNHMHLVNIIEQVK